MATKTDSAGTTPTQSSFLVDGGEMAALIGSFDWSKTSLGPMDHWPNALKTAIGSMLMSPLPIVTLWGEDGVMIYNDAYSGFAGGRHPQLLGSKVREGWPEVADFNDNVMKVCLGGGTLSYKDQELTLHRHGRPEQVWMNLDYSPIMDGHGRPAGVVAFVIETTERVIVERELRESEERMRVATDAAAIGTWDFDPVSGTLRWDDRCKALFGLPPSADIDYDVFLAGLHPDDREATDKAVQAALDPNGPGSYDVEYRAVGIEDRVERWIAATGRSIFGNGSGHKRAVRFTGTVIDISQRVRAEAALREQSRILETLSRTGPALAGELDLQKVVQMVTDAGVELTGAKFGAFFYNVLDDAGESYLLFTLSGARPEQFNFGMPRNTKVFGPTFAGEGAIRSDDITKDPRYGQNPPHKGMPKGHLPVRSYLAVPVVSRSGEVIGGLFFGHPVPGRFNEGHERLLTGIAAQAAIAIDNARLYQAVQRANDTLEHRVQERTAELETANEALRQAQKMEAIGQLTGGIAHDFNNMLTVIRGSADILQRGRIDEAKRERYIQAIADTADRAARLTSQLLAFARRQALKPEVFEVNERLRGIGDILRTVLGSRIKLRIENRCQGCFVETDAAQFETALVNMVVNARDAMDGEGTLLIAIGAADCLGSFKGPQADSGYVTVSVTDTGEGIPPDDLDRIFEPFFTTKETGKGTGLGLSQVYGFAKQSGGEIEVQSEPGSGTTFTMYLPRSKGEHPRAQRKAAATAATVAEGCVLVVEDNPQVGRFAEQVLADLGFDTRRASTAAEALTLLESGEHFDVMFSDIVMPGQSGIDLAREVRKRWPNLPVVLTTGYSDALMMHRDLDFPILHKPYSLEALSGVLAKALEP
ncbi:MAG TPA: ATP-binding protein [Sphingomicrobium sp.]|nr:ATP-binding protein [Sphingomicrobium sp.]